MRFTCLCCLALLCVFTACNDDIGVLADNVDIFDVEWQHEYGPIGYPRARPAVVDDHVFVAGDNYLTSLNMEDGSINWKSLISETRTINDLNLVVGNGQVVGMTLNDVISWDITTGNEQWRWTHAENDTLEPRPIGGGVAIDNGFAFPAYGSRLLVLTSAGAIKYTKKFEDYGVQGLAHADGKLFVGQMKTIHGALTLGRMSCIDAQNGEILWSFDTENGGFTWANPKVENGVVYAGAFGNSPTQTYYAFDAQSGEVLWSQDYISNYETDIGINQIFVKTSADIYALDKETGAVNWMKDYEGSSPDNISYLNGYLYHVRYYRFVVFDAENGSIVYEEYPRDKAYAWNIAAGKDQVFLQTSWHLFSYKAWHLKENSTR